jgi:GDP-D-glucose phosphorylase
VNEFNFNKIDEREILLVKEINGTSVLFLINNSPLTKYHLLIVPEVKENHPQVMTLKCLELAFEIMKSTDDKAIRLGYNSPGALASVNHLHLHMLHVDRELYVETIVSWNQILDLIQIS